MDRNSCKKATSKSIKIKFLLFFKTNRHHFHHPYIINY